MESSTKTQRKRINSLIASEHFQDISREEITLADVAATGVDLLGQPIQVDLSDYTGVAVAAADIANANAICVSEKLSVDGETPKVSVIVRGPVALKTAGFAATDKAGAAITQSAFIAAMHAAGFKIGRVAADANTYSAPSGDALA